LDEIALRVAERWKEKIPGGLARVPPKVDPKQVEKGIKVELEHTNDRSIAREIAYDHLTEDPIYYDKLEEMEKKAADLSTPEKAADYLLGKLRGMFPDHFVEVRGERGVGIAVGRVSEEEYAREQVSSHYTSPPNLMVKIVIAPSRMGPSTWANLNLNPASDNPELRAAGVQPIRKAGGLTPDQAIDRVLKWFAKNRSLLKGEGMEKAGEEHLSVIKKEKGQYCVRSPNSPDWNGGCFDSKGEAEKRLKQVEYFKHKDSAWRVVLAFAKSKGIAFEKLKSMSKKELKELGCSAWDNPKDGRVTMLFPAEWYDEIPNGLDVVDIFGEAEKFQRGKSDKDQRMGFLPYGVMIKIAVRKALWASLRKKEARINTRIVVDIPKTLAARKKYPLFESMVIARFDQPVSMYRVFDGNELKHMLATGKITGGNYSVKAEREHGASWGHDITPLVQYGNQQRGKRFDQNIYLAKLDSFDHYFAHLDPEVTVDPSGPEEQEAVMDSDRCFLGLGCSIMNLGVDDVDEFYRVLESGRIERMSLAELRAEAG
jgi:hypothetical protein